MISTTLQIYQINTKKQEKDLNYLLNILSSVSRRRRDQFNLAFDMCMRYLNVCPSQGWVAQQVGYAHRGTSNQAFKVLVTLGLIEMQNRGKYPGKPYMNKTCLLFLPDWFTPELCAQYKAHLRSLKDQFSCKFVETRRQFKEFTNGVTKTIKQKVTHIKSSFSSKPFFFKNIYPVCELSTKSNTEETQIITSSKKEEILPVQNSPNCNNPFTKYIPKGVGWEDQFKDEITLDQDVVDRFTKIIDEAESNRKALLKERLAIDAIPDCDETKQTILANWRSRNTEEQLRWLSQSEELKKEDSQLFDMLYRK